MSEVALTLAPVGRDPGSGRVPVMDALFRPRSIVVVGASDDPRKAGGKLLAHLLRHGFAGELYLVNPARPSVQGRAAYPSVADLPAAAAIDLALVATPAAEVPGAVAALAARGVWAAVIVSSGFGETGDAGREAEERALAACGDSGMRLLGPNCQGVANIGAGVVASFSSAFGPAADIPDGSAAVLSQSGGMAAVLTQLALPHVDGLRYWAASGNEIDLRVADLLRYVVDDPAIRTVQVYLESLGDAANLAAAGRAATANGTAVLVLKSGTTAAGGRAAGSHTGALAQEDAVVEAFLRRHGMIRARDPREMSELVRLFTSAKRPCGSRVAIVTNSGGLGVLLTDESVTHGLRVAEFAPATVHRLSAALPPFAAVHNPIDVTAELLSRPELIREALAAVADDPGVDVVLLGVGMLGEYYDLDRILADVVVLNRRSDKLVVVCCIASQAGMVERFAAEGVPTFDDTTGCVRALGRLVAHTEQVRRTAAAPEPEPAAPGGEAAVPGAGSLSEHAGKVIVGSWGLPVVPGRLVECVDEAVAAGRAFGYPVVAKLSAPSVAHKTELGLIEVGIADDAAMAAAAARLLAAAGPGGVVKGPIDGVLVEPMVAGGLEMAVGVVHDPDVGPVIMVGTGGTQAELLADVRLLIPPLTEAAVRDALASLTLFPLLDGYRGAPPRDVDAFVRLVLDLAAAPPVAAGRVAELDLNPVLVLPAGKGVSVVDVALTVREPDPTGEDHR